MTTAKVEERFRKLAYDIGAEMLNNPNQAEQLLADLVRQERLEEAKWWAGGNGVYCRTQKEINEHFAALSTPSEACGVRQKRLETFKGHRLIGIACNHKAKTETATCECGWVSMPWANIGGAFDVWLEHAHAALSAPGEASK